MKEIEEKDSKLLFLRLEASTMNIETNEEDTILTINQKMEDYLNNYKIHSYHSYVSNEDIIKLKTLLIEASHLKINISECNNDIPCIKEKIKLYWQDYYENLEKKEKKEKEKEEKEEVESNIHKKRMQPQSSSFRTSL